MTNYRLTEAALSGLVLSTLMACGGVAPVADDAGGAIAAAAPANDIYLVPISRDASVVSLGVPRNVTARRGYDNQPHFTADGRSFYYASIRDGKQSDIYLYDLEADSHTQITDTPQSEYSPTVTPDGIALTTVRVGLDGDQQLWRLGLDGSVRQSLTPSLTNVGYHAWLNEQAIAMFLVGEPHTLSLLRTDLGNVRELASDIGRSLQTVPNRTWAGFVHNRDGTEWVSVLQYPSGLTMLLTPVLEGSEDFVFGHDGGLYMARGKSVYVWGRQPEQWSMVAEYNSLPGPISRMAMNPQGDTLALVVSETEEPPGD